MPNTRLHSVAETLASSSEAIASAPISASASLQMETADAMRWVGDGRPITRDECLRWFEVTRANYAVRGYGMFAVEETASSDAIGFCGIVHPGGQPEPEIKYAYLRARWGRGYATEAVAGLIRYGASVHGLRHLVATTAPSNVASHRVLLKAGMARAALRANDDGSWTQLFRWNAPGVAPKTAPDRADP